MSLKSCRGHNRSSKGAFQIFVVNGSKGKLTFKSNFSLLSSFQVKFERVINGLGGQIANGQQYVYHDVCVYVCVCVCVCMHACVYLPTCMWISHSPTLNPTHPHPPDLECLNH